MKTTVELSSSLLKQAKSLAAREGTTLRALIEEGLRAVVARRRTDGSFVLRDASVAGKGTQAGVTEGAWADIRERIYEDRGA